MAVTEASYTGNGSTTNYSFTFPYLKSTDVEVQVDATVTTAWTFANATTVQFNTAPANGAKIKILRQTNVDNLTATFYAGSAIKSEDLNDNFTQNLYSTQEKSNRAFETTGGTITGDVALGEDVTVTFEGATDNAHEITVTVADPSSDTTLTLPNTTGTVVTTGDTNTVTSTMITDGTIVDADINASAAIAGTKITPNFGSQNISTTGTINDLTTTELAILDGATVTTAELNILDGVTATTAEVNLLDGVTATTAELNYTDGVTSNIQTQLNAKQASDNELTELATMASDTASSLADLTAAEVQTLDGITASTTELNILDGVTSTTGELNILDGVTSTATELNILDGVTATTAEINYVDGVTSNVQTQLDAKQPLDGDLSTLAGMQSATASILASSTALTSTTAELNLLDGKSIVTTISGSSTDVQLPTAKAVDDRITSLVTDVGGFRPIANETSFPTENPDPEDNAGTIVSIKALDSPLTSNGSGVATITNGAGSGNNVTISGMANNDTIEAGKGILVETTATSGNGSANPPREYTFHRETLAPADITAAKTAVDDFGDRYQIAGSTPSAHPDSSALQEGDLWFDTGANIMKVYDGSNYAAVTSVGDYKLLTVVPDGATSGTPDYTNVSFDLRDGSSAASITSVGQLLVSVNGVLQKPNSTSWSASNEGFHLEGTNGIKFCTAPGTGASVFVTLIGSATSVNVPATNSIVEAAIQTNQVSEEKLKVSNNPTNGQFLSAQSGNDGGLTWADGASEGTSVKSTGESGGTKFLREDGDGTCSWQTVSQYTTPLTTRGDILYRGASADARLAKGTSGQYLKIGANDPEWADVVAATADGVLWENNLTISNNYTIAATKGAHSVGPITNNATVTVNGRWVIS